MMKEYKRTISEFTKREKEIYNFLKDYCLFTPVKHWSFSYWREGLRVNGLRELVKEKNRDIAKLEEEISNLRGELIHQGRFNELLDYLDIEYYDDTDYEEVETGSKGFRKK